jgi:iron-sulfur cluster repair protein YtfE (RIC family)
LAASLAKCATAEEVADLRVHLGDLREGCAHAIELIERVAALDAQSHPLEMRTALAHLKGELVQHMLSHIQGVSPSLTAVVSRLYIAAEKEDPGERG